MRDKQGFRTWLDLNSELTDNSKNRYATAIDHLSKKYGVSLYSSTSIERIKAILADQSFKDFNDSQGRMFSASLNHFKKYILYCNDIEDINTAILKEKLKYEEKQRKVTVGKVMKEDIKDMPKPKPNSVDTKGRKVWNRDPVLAAEALVLANYCCEIDRTHKHFISKATNQNYVEAHHLIPISHQDNHKHSLDIHANIVPLCVVCHKQVHHGVVDDKKAILESLFNNRSERLIASGINIDLNQLYSCY